MSVKTTLPISEARKKIFKIAEEVQKPNRYYTLTEKGRAKAVIVSAEEFESLMETIEIITNPLLMKEIKESREDYKKGNYVGLEQVLKNVSSSTKKIGSKRFRKGR